jgi:hypothetical protein
MRSQDLVRIPMPPRDDQLDLLFNRHPATTSTRRPLREADPYSTATATGRPPTSVASPGCAGPSAQDRPLGRAASAPQ